MVSGAGVAAAGVVEVSPAGLAGGPSGTPSPGSQVPAERELWRTWTTELGLPGLVIPEEHGGSGFSRLELSVAAEELGRAVAGGPLQLCPACDRLYWPGGHVRRMLARLEQFTAD